MNKTININLAGLFFHIDEDAYAKLQHYLDVIKRSFTDAEGRDEIIQDIEARIAELFTERIKHERQVISNLEVDQVIGIMGQPEDYRIDEEIFEDEEPKAAPYTSRQTKKLYRDIENSYLGGVSSGLGYYLGIPPIWIRILFVVLTFLTSGGFALLYIGFWIFVPAAKTTAQKLEMRGEPVNIDNIQRKVKEGFDTVADSVKNVNYEKYGTQAKKSAGSVAEGIGKVVVLLLTVLAKLIGILLIIIGGTAIVGLFITFFTAGTLGFMHSGLHDYISLFNAGGGIPFWVLYMLLFFALAIPFFSLFYLGLKILVTNLKRMSWAMKITLIVVWLASIVILTAVGINQAMDFSQRASTTQTEDIQMNPLDTLRVKMTLQENVRMESGWFLDMNRKGKPFISMGDIDLSIKQSENDRYTLALNKTARGHNNTSAREHAEDIVYRNTLENNTLLLPETFALEDGAALRAQELELILYVPENGTIFIDKNSRNFLSHRSDLMEFKTVGHYLKLLNGKLVCSDCPEESNINTDDEWQYRDISDDVNDSGT